MADDLDSTGETLFDPQDIVLRIPAEHFFCECIDLPKNLEEKELEAFAEEVMEGLSPFPVEHLYWGYHASLEHGKALLFGALSSKLRQLGWENMEMFRRVFPSFVSLFSDEFGKRFDRPTICFLLHEESLTAAAFDGHSPIPLHLFSQPLGEEEVDSGTIEISRGKLLARFVDLNTYEIDTRILRTGQTTREKDAFRFDHLDDDFEDAVESFKLDAEKLWRDDVRGIPFKRDERKRRRLRRLRWSTLIGSVVAACLITLMDVGLIFLTDKVDFVTSEAQKGVKKVKGVKDLEAVLDKLEQNDRGGIDPFGAFELVNGGRHKDNPKDPLKPIPVVWFKEVNFPSRNQLVIKGKGENVEAINDYLDELGKTNKIEIDEQAIRSDRSDNKMIFSVNLILKEETPPVAKLEVALPK